MSGTLNLLENVACSLAKKNESLNILQDCPSSLIDVSTSKGQMGDLDHDPEIFLKLSGVYIVIVLSHILSHFPTKCPEFFKQLSRIIFINVTLILFSPILISLYALLLIHRLILTVIFKFVYNGSVKLMEAADNAWAPETYAHCNNFTALYILQGECNLKDIQQRIKCQLAEKRGTRGELVYEKMHFSVVKKFGFYCWEKKQEFNIENHVTLLEEGLLELSEDQLFEKFQTFADEPMSDEMPQWKVLIVPRYTYNETNENKDHDENKNQRDGETEKSKMNHFAMIFRIHHSIMDGVSAGHALKHILADYPMKFSVDPLKPLKIHPLVKFLGYLKCLVMGPSLIYQAMILRENNCFRKSDLTGPKSFGWSRPVSVSGLKKIKDFTKTTTTAVLVSSIGGSVRNLALKKKLDVPKRIQTSPTVAMLPYPDIAPRNRFVCIHYPLEISLPTTRERLDSANETAKKLSTSPFALATFLTIKICGIFPAIIVEFLMSCVDATVILSNVPGPAEPAYLFGGHLMVDSVSWVPLKNSIGIGVCLFSYAGRVRANFVTDKSCLPNPTDLHDLIQGFEHELSLLARSTDVSPQELFVPHLQSSECKR